ncbi:hypothetical protein L9F63_006842, partial [Diploptera punctata]
EVLQCYIYGFYNIEEVIKLNEENIEKARELIEEGKLEEALEISTEVMKKAIKEDLT